MCKDHRFYYVVDLETAVSADSLSTGWNDKAALGLSIGAWWSSLDHRIYFFDVHTLETVISQWVQEQPLLVSFAGKQFDFPLMRSVLRRRAQESVDSGLAGRGVDAEERAALLTQHNRLMRLCDAFKLLCATSYDILAAVWAADPASKRIRGINGLGNLAAANGYGGKTGDGAQAPREWAACKYAQVINYCAHDVFLTKALFEQILCGEPLKRSDGSVVHLPPPTLVSQP